MIGLRSAALEGVDMSDDEAVLREALQELLSRVEALDKDGNAAGIWLLMRSAMNKARAALSRPHPETLVTLQKLADAADDVGVRFFDTDTMDPLVEAMREATRAARKVLAKGRAAEAVRLMWPHGTPKHV